jgi:6-phosphogluconolactonase (cycloisomerase 2 family)
VLDPSGRFAYVANRAANGISAFCVDATSGALTPVGGSPFAAGSEPGSVAIDPSGRFAYVANLGSASIASYLIDAGTGALVAPTGGVPTGGGCER